MASQEGGGTGEEGPPAPDTPPKLEMESRALTRGDLRWQQSSVPRTLQLDPPSAVGDCFFACVALWLNVVLGSTLFDARRLRMCLAATLAWPGAACVLERVRDDLCHYDGLQREATFADMQCLVLDSSTWADHPLMSVTALFCSRLLGCRCGFLVVKLEQTGNDGSTGVLVVKPPVEEGDPDPELEVACVLHLLLREHYTLLADRETRHVLFDVLGRRWRAGRPNVCAWMQETEDGGVAAALMSGPPTPSSSGALAESEAGGLTESDGDDVESWGATRIRCL